MSLSKYQKSKKSKQGEKKRKSQPWMEVEDDSKAKPPPLTEYDTPKKRRFISVDWEELMETLPREMMSPDDVQRLQLSEDPQLKER